jgi:hypothetical protein
VVAVIIKAGARVTALVWPTDQARQNEQSGAEQRNVSIVSDGPKGRVGVWGLTTDHAGEASAQRWVLVVKPKYQGPHKWEGIYREGVDLDHDD